MPTPKSRAATPERPAEILRAVESERLSLRAVERVLRVARKTGARGRERKAARRPPLSETLLPAGPGEGLALDALWSFVGSRANAR